MPTLETADGEPVDVTPESDVINAQFADAMNSDGPPEQELPKRAVRGPATDEPKPRAARARAPKAEKAEKARTAARPSATLTGDQRRDGVRGLVQVAATVPLVLNRATGHPAYLADALALSAHADPLADACAQVADADPRFAAVLDRVCAAGPYSALVGVAVSLAAQLARNHRPGLALPGTVHPDVLLASGQQQAA